MTNRPAIPDAMKRAVRQRCGFGCVVCGDFPYEYHHLTAWTEVREHEESNLTLLCTKHHTEATGERPLLPGAAVEDANQNPINLSRGFTPPSLLHYASEPISMILGDMQVTAPPEQDCWAVVVDQVPILGFKFEDGRYLLSAQFADNFNRPMLTIKENELVHGSRAFDVERVANRLVIRRRLGDVLLHIEFEPPSIVRVKKASLWWNGVNIEARTDGVEIRGANGDGLRLAGLTAEAPIAVWIGPAPVDYGQLFVLEPNRFPYPGDGGVFDAVRDEIAGLFDRPA